MKKYNLFVIFATIIITSLILLSFTSCNDSKVENKIDKNLNNKSQTQSNSEYSKTKMNSNLLLKPKNYKFELVRKFEHDKTAFTQGLLYRNGIIYESTGLNGKSTLRKINYETGEILNQKKIETQYFAEGLEFIDNKFYLLTYKNGTCLTYDPYFKQLNEKYAYEGEGWGLCSDGKLLYKSNGSNIIEIRDKTFNLIKKLNVLDENGNQIYYINEMEYIEGKIWANIWGYAIIVVINPENGKLEQKFDFSHLIDLLGSRESIDVMNGIAYNPEKNTILLTGKYWDTFFEYKIIVD